METLSEMPKDVQKEYEEWSRAIPESQEWDRALRYNTGKPQYSYIDMQCLEPMVRVMEYGASKYERDNWKKGFPELQLFDCLLRHIAAYLGGEKIDPESGISHIGHIQANAMFLGLSTNTK